MFFHAEVTYLSRDYQCHPHTSSAEQIMASLLQYCKKMQVFYALEIVFRLNSKQMLLKRRAVLMEAVF